MPLTGVSPSTTIRQCLERQWDISIHCDVCSRRARWTAAELRALPPDATLDDLAKRLRCNVCGATEGVLSTLNGRSDRGSA